MNRIHHKFLVHLFAFASLFIVPSALLASDIPPVISGIKIATTTERSAIITWTTDKLSDSLVNYGLDSNYGSARDPANDRRDHAVTVTGLEPSTVYYFRVISNDVDGNQSVSNGFTLTTKGTVNVKDIKKVPTQKERTLVEKIVGEIQNITSAQAIRIIHDEVEAKGSAIDKPPAIFGVPDLKEISYDYVIVRWVTDKEASTMATFSSDDEYSPEAWPYAYTQGDPGSRELEHEIKIIGLTPATKYHLRVFSEDDLGLMSKSDDQVFTTKSVVPEIKSVDVIKVEDTAATIGWDTTIPASGMITYTNTRTQETKSQGSPEFATNHNVRLENLDFGVQYDATVTVENEAGDKVVSEPFSFTTIKDEAPPVISSVTNESTLYPTADAKIQTIVNWSTDELASCQFFYRQSLADTGEASSLDPEVNPDVSHVQVVLEFLPSTVYKFWIECTDRTGNLGRSEDFVLFTPDKEKSILDIIIENFQGTFGWVKNIGK